MRAADLFVLGSHREGGSSALVEAMATGLTPGRDRHPVVARADGQRRRRSAVALRRLRAPSANALQTQRRGTSGPRRARTRARTFRRGAHRPALGTKARRCIHPPVGRGSVPRSAQVALMSARRSDGLVARSRARSLAFARHCAETRVLVRAADLDRRRMLHTRRRCRNRALLRRPRRPRRHRPQRRAGLAATALGIETPTAFSFGSASGSSSCCRSPIFANLLSHSLRSGASRKASAPACIRCSSRSTCIAMSASMRAATVRRSRHASIHDVNRTVGGVIHRRPDAVRQRREHPHDHGGGRRRRSAASRSPRPPRSGLELCADLCARAASASSQRRDQSSCIGRAAPS